MRQFNQFKVILKHGINNEFANKERLVSPLLFAGIVIILFSFAMEGTSDDLKIKLFTAETYLTLFFALQISFSRIFEPDHDDQAFLIMRTYPVSPSSWFLAKFSTLFISGFLILIPTILFTALVNLGGFEQVFAPKLFGFAILSMIGLSSLGVLLAAMLEKTPAKQILFPLIYFPLATPILLGSIHGTFALFDNSAPTESIIDAWTSLLIAFDVIYFTLSLLLFGELVDES